MRTALWVVLAVAVVFLPDAAWACSCLPSSPCQRFDRTDAIFLGKIASVRQEGMRVFVTMDVIRTWKGQVDKRVTVSSSAGTSCSFEFVVGQRFLVYGDGAGAEFSTFMCQGGGLLPEDAPDPDLPPRPGRVRGQVAHLDIAPSTRQRFTERPVSSARVWLETRSGVLETHADADGLFTLDGVPPGEHIVRADVGPAYEAVGRVELEYASDCASVFLMPRPSGRLNGKLSSPAGVPVGETEIYAVPVGHDWTKVDLSDSRRTNTDRAGRFEFTGLLPGKYLLTVNAVHPPRVSQPFAPTYYPGVGRREDAVAVEIGQGQAPETVTFVLKETLPLASITADILCRDGSLPRSGLVYARQMVPNNFLTESTYTAVDGRFSLTVLAGVPYEVYGEVLVPVRGPDGREGGFTGLRTATVGVPAGSTSLVRLVAPLDRCQETTIGDSR